MALIETFLVKNPHLYSHGVAPLS